MVYYSFTDIMKGYKLSKEQLKSMCQSGKIKGEKLVMSKTSPDFYKWIIPESELYKIAKYKISEITASKASQPDFYTKRWEEQRIQREAMEEKRRRYQAILDKFSEQFFKDMELYNAEHGIKNEHPFNKEEYLQYLRSEEYYRNKKLPVLKRDNFQCQICGTAKNLTVHHITYWRLFDEDLDDLITLCDICHYKVHMNDFLNKESN